VKSTVDCHLEHYNNIEPDQIINLLSVSDLAIVPSSTIALEVCHASVPLITGLTATNQRNIHDELIRAGCAVTVNDFYNISLQIMREAIEKVADFNIRKSIIEKQHYCFDKKASIRILNEFLLIN